MTEGPDHGVSPAERVRRAAVTLAALSQGGLEYGVGEYDRDRYRKVGAVAADLLAAVTDRSAERLARRARSGQRLRHPQGRP